MRTVVTGAGGFIGRSLCERLLSAGLDVLAVDSLDDYYAPERKQAHLSELTALGAQVRVVDLRTEPLAELLAGAEAVFHLAGQPGVRGSWADGFERYVTANVLTTQRLLEAARERPGLRLVLASSSSVYGDAVVYPCREDGPVSPVSPYGVTKLSAEHLCDAYAANFGVQSVVMRYFTVYGPRQRPDMAFHRFIEAGLDGREISLFGDGGQVRDFTYVADVVSATMLAATADLPPATRLNVAGGSSTTVLEVLSALEAALGVILRVRKEPPQAGDVRRTGGATERLRALGWEPATELVAGVAAQVAWHRSLRAT